MISLAIFLIVLVLLFGVFKLYSKEGWIETIERYGSEKEKIKTSSIIKASLALLLAFLAIVINPIAVERIDSGYVGIKVDNVGDKKGNSSIEYKRGWVFYNSWFSRIYEFPIHQQHIDYESTLVITKGGFETTIKPSFNYSINPGNVDDMFQNLRVGVKQMEQGWLKNAIISSVNDVANLFTVDSIFNHRAEFEAAIIKECNKRVSKWFTVSQLRTNIVPPEPIRKAIEEKTKAVQEAQAAIQRKVVAEAVALEKIATAKGDSAQKVIQASGEANAIKLKQLSLTPEYIEYIKVTTWDGKLPQTVLGSGNGLMINLK
jgi:regulator of protease activity HflC (stomatin/prohibitin superfamily)